MFMYEYNGFAMRGEFDDDQKLWIPLEDIRRIRGVPISVWHLRRSNLRDGIDYRKVHLTEDEIARALYRTNSAPKRSHRKSDGTRAYRGSPFRVLVSEAGMYRLMMSGRTEADRQMQYWLADEVIPAIRQYGQYNLPADHPMYAVLKEVSDELKVYRDIVWSGDLKLRDLAGRGGEG